MDLRKSNQSRYFIAVARLASLVLLASVIALSWCTAAYAIELRLVTSASGAANERKANPIFSPDGTQLTYISGADFPPYNEYFSWAISIPQPFLGGSTALRFNGLGGFDILQSLSWSPDGTQLVGAGQVRGAWELSGLWIFTPNDPPRQLVSSQQYINHASWSPDGRIITYSAPGGMHLVFAAGGPSVPMTLPGYAPAWGPESLAYVQGGQIWVSDSSGPRALTTGPSQNKDPSWSSDGNWIVFSSNRSGSWDLWIIAQDSGSPVQITTEPASDDQPNWSRDGQQIAFISKRSGTPEVWIASDLPDLTTAVQSKTWTAAKTAYR